MYQTLILSAHSGAGSLSSNKRLSWLVCGKTEERYADMRSYKKLRVHGHGISANALAIPNLKGATQVCARNLFVNFVNVPSDKINSLNATCFEKIGG